MQTDFLISLLATDVPPADRHAVARRLGIAWLAGAGGAMLLVLSLYGPRPDLAAMLATTRFWLKLSFPAGLSLIAAAGLARVARPGMRVSKAWGLGLSLPVVLLWAAGLLVWSLAAPALRDALLFGHTWRSCPFSIPFLSLPGFVALFHALRGLAPTRLRLAGALAGLLAGATATLAYCLHCPEMGVPFWAVWYVLGIAAPTVLGALAGPAWLRW
ncbi:hypothetical protein C7405_1325 [Paraburkholderia caballeronis]|uniref:DUF1109 domain-containing protein n=1 Tax=Paraburkholderia caballeronis TaxID=416943 RepID=UPI001065F4F7|nr:DUF1109 domain-containing protein [Paraburkholderia caballeronis]TDV23310.1 hypothetical protein C7405_1325 [Paraburkholderia caballeronis]